MRTQVIVFLDTGSGKTIISAELIHARRAALSGPDGGPGGKVAVFLAPNIPLITQVLLNKLLRLAWLQ